MKTNIFVPIVVMLVSFSARSVEWQWSQIIKNAKENPGTARAFLWIPPDCRKVRGVILAQNNMEEEMILENPRFREALEELGFAEIWCAPGFDHLFRFNEGAGDAFNELMGDLASLSGYEELKFVPIVGLGHSAAASWPYYFAAWNPGRTLAAISVSGQWPWFRDKAFAPDIWGDRNIDFVPCLESMGEYESANTWSNEGLEERKRHPLMPLSMLANPAQGHFASTDAKVEYLVLYLKKAVQYRVPADWKVNGAPKLQPIDPTKTGWLVDRWRLNQLPTAAAAPDSEYKGDAKQAFWFFDGELAKTTEMYEAAHRGKKTQLVGYVQDGKMVPQSNEHLQVNLKFEPLADGVTFKLTGAFYDLVPGGSPRPADWAGSPAGSPIDHANGGGPVSIDRIVGPFEKLAPDTFALRFQKEATGKETRYELVFAATHPGNNDYKPAVQQAHMYVPARNIEGMEQHISFPEIKDIPANVKTVKLKASSDANVPVYYYVREGPAEIDGDQLIITKIPSRAKFPLKVTVVAWQYGRNVEPRLQTATPVERTFDVTRW